jgi:hypothetical protein
MCLWPNIKDLPDVKPLWETLLSYSDGYGDGFAAGAAAQSKDDRGIHREQNSRPIEGGVNE